MKTSPSISTFAVLRHPVATLRAVTSAAPTRKAGWLIFLVNAGAVLTLGLGPLAAVRLLRGAAAARSSFSTPDFIYAELFTGLIVTTLVLAVIGPLVTLGGVALGAKILNALVRKLAKPSRGNSSGLFAGIGFAQVPLLFTLPVAVPAAIVSSVVGGYPGLIAAVGVPFLGFTAFVIWGSVLAFIAVRENYGFSNRRTVAVVTAPVLAVAALIALLVPLGNVEYSFNIDLDMSTNGGSQTSGPVNVTTPSATLAPQPSTAAEGSAIIRLTDNTGEDYQPSWSPDGSSIAFISDRDGNFDIYVMNADGSEITRLTDNLHYDTAPAWSPDGSKIAFASISPGSYGISVMNADGSGVTRLTHKFDYDRAPAWSPDGTKIAFSRITFTSDGTDPKAIYVMNADGSGITHLTDYEPFDADLAWSPDGDRIVFSSFADDNVDIYVVNVDGSGPTRITNDPAIDEHPAWSPDGTRIAFASRRHGGEHEIYVMNVDGSGVTRITNHRSEDAWPAWSPDGSKIAFTSQRDGNYDIYVITADAGVVVRPAATPTPTPAGPTPTPTPPPIAAEESGLTRVTIHLLGDSRPAWAPDGDRFAFNSMRDGDPEIYVMNTDGSDLIRLTTSPGNDLSAAWSPDGGRIAFSSRRNGLADIYVMNADGSDVTRLTDFPANETGPAWSPDGTRIAFIGGSPFADVYVMNADGTGVINLTNDRPNDQSLSWSPGGDRIAFSSIRDGNTDIYVMNADGSGITRLTSHPATDRSPAWSPDGARIAFVSRRDGRHQEIYVMYADGSGITRLTDHPDNDDYPAWSPDGTRLAFASRREANLDIYTVNVVPLRADPSLLTPTPTPTPMAPQSTPTAELRFTQNDMAGPPRNIASRRINEARGTVARIFSTPLVQQTEVPEEHIA